MATTYDFYDFIVFTKVFFLIEDKINAEKYHQKVYGSRLNDILNQRHDI